VNHLTQSTASGPEVEADPAALNERGGALLSRGRAAEAAACFLKAAAIDPAIPELHFNLGLALRNQGDAEGAERSFRNALRLKPGFGPAQFALGNLLFDAGDAAGAEACYRSAIASAPDFADAYYNLANIARTRCRMEDARALYQQAVRLRPDYAEALNNLGLVLKDLGRLDAAAACYRKAVRLKPSLVEAHYNLGVAAQLQGRFEEGLDHFRSALAVRPAYGPARWLYLLSLPVVYRSADEIAVQRARFASNLGRLISQTRLTTDLERADALEGVGSTTHFFLQYQAQDDRDLQAAYGAFAARVMASNFPRWAAPRRMPGLAPGERIRVGYVSSFMRAHTVGQFLLGWLEGHDRKRFQISAFHVGTQTDFMTDRIRAQVDRFHPVGGCLRTAAEHILAEDLHILIYTDIGMNALTTQLAALRLAPVQCKGWGHPVTTGLPTIDYYLSSDLMEPADARAHYTETLVRLPNLALHYSPPRLPSPPASRATLGLRTDAVVYLNSQSLFKNLPQHDDIYPRIAARVPAAQFVFIGHGQPEVTRRFEQRLAAAFADRGLRSEDHCTFVPKLNFPDFLSLNLASDVLLDTLEWSGGKTTLEAISCGLPVVTCPGRFMRGRHAYAMLRMMQIEQTVCGTKDQYIETAVGLGLDPDARARLRDLIRKRRTRLYADRVFMSALEDFYDRVVRGLAQESNR
jgi:predicted O-linked N-acetylglucosamine transferase (SPINDLY family)